MKGSRGFSHEQVRHRFAVSQRSTRYCDEASSEWALHPLMQQFMAQDPTELAKLCSTKKDSIGPEMILSVFQNTAALVGGSRQSYRLYVKLLMRWLRKRIPELSKKDARKQARGAARGLLGNALQTEMIFTGSVADWQHMVNMRCSKPADAEIRMIFAQALPLLKASRYGEHFEHFELEDSDDGLGQHLAGGGHK